MSTDESAHRQCNTKGEVIVSNEAFLTAYQNFLTEKVAVKVGQGLTVPVESISPLLKPHQRDTVLWALRGGRRLIAKSFGLGKTMTQLEMMRQVHMATGQKTLIVCPLGVKHQFQRVDGPMLGMAVQYVTCDEDVMTSTTPYLLTNYERVRDGGISAACIASEIGAVTLDEGSVLRDLGSKTFQVFSEIFASVRYRFVATATPAPNRYKELIQYADFLGIMDTGQALTRFFKRDSSKANNLTIMPSQEHEFWLWVASWALFIQRPSDLGYDDDGYILPELKVIWHRLGTDHERAWAQTDSWGQRFLLANSANGISAASSEKRASMSLRVAHAAQIMADADPADHWIIWHHLEDERKAITQAIPGATEVFGSQDLELREQRIMDFSEGKLRVLASKPSITGSGCNFQYHCHKNIFLGVNYEFEDFIQAVNRTHRYLQQHPVEVHIIYTEAEDDIVETMKRKWTQHGTLLAKMTDIIKSYGLTAEALKMDLQRTMGVERREVSGEWFTCVNNDTVLECAGLPDDSIDMIVTSIPFGTQYEYAASYNDFGHNEDNEHFWRQMDFLIPTLYRILRPGRIVCIHVKDRVVFGRLTGLGFPTLEPFSDDCVRAFRKHGFAYIDRKTIVTDVVRENNQTYRLGWSENAKDGTKMGGGLPEYWLVFRKPQTDRTAGYADVPVVNEKSSYTRRHWQIDASNYWRSGGNRLLTPNELAEMAQLRQVYRWYANYSREAVYDYHAHAEMGSALEERGRLPASFMLFNPSAPDAFAETVWSVHDYVRMRTLNSGQSKGREENHTCPLPLDLIERMIRRYSNEGDLVFDPFGGLSSVPYMAVKMNRRGYSVELNFDYWRAGVRYCQGLELQKKAPTLFDMLEIEAEPVDEDGEDVLEEDAIGMVM